MNNGDKLKKAYHHQSCGEFDEAVTLFRELSGQENMRERALLEIGKSYKMKGVPAEALNYFKELLSLGIWSGEALEEFGMTARLSGEEKEAIRFLEEESDRSGPVFLELSRLYLQTGDAERALRYAVEAQSDDSIRLRASVQLGKIYKKKNDYAKGSGLLEEALRSLPEDRDLLFELGDLRSLSGDFGGAVSFFEKLTAYHPEEKEAWLRLTDLYTQLGNEAKAEESSRRALKLVSDTPFEKDVMLNEIEILKRKTLLSSRVKRLWVTVTTRCNIQCKTCGLWPYKWDLPYETAKEVMELYPYLERLVWLGGEVFLYKHFEEMFDKASVYPNLRQQVITNGVILDRRWIEKIVKTVNTELTFSVDGTTKEVYESIRCGSNFEKLLENIRLTMKLKKELNPSLDVRMNALIMKSNYHQLEGLLDFARDLGFNQITYLTVHFDNSPGENIFYENRDPEILKKIGEAIPKLREKAKTCRMDIDILLPPGALDFGDIVRKEEPTAAKPDESVKKPPRDHRKGIYCKMPWKYMMICDQGGVLLTGSCIKPIGNINENSLHDIWNSPDARLYRKKMLANEFEGLCRTECASRW